VGIDFQGRISANFGQNPFVYNLSSMPLLLLSSIKYTLDNTKEEKLKPKDDFGDLLFTPIAENDLTELANLHDEVFKEHNLYSAAFYLKFLLPEFCNVLAKRVGDNKIVGFATSRIEEVSKTKQAYFMTFGVNAEYRTRGLGSFLLSHVILQLTSKNVKHMTLHTQADESALNFYLNRKFTITKLLPKYYTTPTRIADGFFLSRFISESDTLDLEKMIIILIIDSIKVIITKNGKIQCEDKKF